MKNLKMVLPVSKPRNPTVVALHGLKAGSHRKSNKAVRQKDKQDLKKKTSNLEVFCFNSSLLFDIDKQKNYIKLIIS